MPGIPVDAVIAFDPAVDTVRCGDRVFDEQQAEFAAFYCVTDDTVLFDNANLMPELYRIGDFAMGFEIARQYSFAAQIRLGNDSNDREAELQADCFVGAYVASTIQGFGPARPQDPNVDRLFSSPGDLDEVIISFLAGADANEKRDRVRTGRRVPKRSARRRSPQRLRAVAIRSMTVEP